MDGGDHGRGDAAPEPRGVLRWVARGVRRRALEQRRARARRAERAELGERLDVEPRAERVAGAVEHDRAHRAVVRERHGGLGERVEHLHVEPVALLRPVQRDERDA